MYDILQTTADKAAKGLGFIQRKRKLTGGSFIKTLVLGWFESPDASYADLANTAQDLGIDITRQGIAKPMTKEAAETLKTTLETMATQVLKSKTALQETLEKIKEAVLNSDKRIQCLGKNTTYNLLQNMQNP